MPEVGTSKSINKRHAYAAVNQQEQKINGLQSELTRVKNKVLGYVDSIVLDHYVEQQVQLETQITHEQQVLQLIKDNLGIVE